MTHDFPPLPAVCCGEFPAVKIIEEIDSNQIEPPYRFITMQVVIRRTYIDELTPHTLVGQKEIEAVDTCLMRDRHSLLPIIINAVAKGHLT